MASSGVTDLWNRLLEWGIHARVLAGELVITWEWDRPPTVEQVEWLVKHTEEIRQCCY
jgi:hypothetical protein